MKQVQDTFDIFYKYISSPSAQGNEGLLDNWASVILSNNDHGFEKGLLGLGWLIGYLIDHAYVEGNADEILEDIDDTVYKLTIKGVLDPETDAKQLLHYVTYYQQRIQCKSNAPFYRRFVHFECMKLLLEKLNTFLIDHVDITSADNLSDQVRIVLKYSYLTQTCVNEKLVEEAFYTAIERILNFFESQQCLNKFEDELAQLSVCIHQYGNPHWGYLIDRAEKKMREENDMEKSRDTSVWLRISSAFTINKPICVQDILAEAGMDKRRVFMCCTNIKPDFIIK